MIGRKSLFAALPAITLLLVANSAAQQPYVATHSGGRMAMSPNGENITFTALGTPSSEFLLLHVPTQRSFLIAGPHPHIGDFGWSPDGDELTFVTAQRHTLGGDGRHVWRLRLDDPAPTIQLLALIPTVRSPVLSADGARLVAYEGVIAGDGVSHGLNTAYAIFERNVADGVATRRSAGHTRLGGDLFYDRQGAIFVQTSSVMFPQAWQIDDRILYSWVSRDSTGREEHQWRTSAFSFRILPGETLPEWPTTFPTAGELRNGALIRPLDDGRVVLYGSANPHTTADWYDERGRPRTPTRRAQYDYVAFASDGAAEVLVSDPLPEGAGRMGGADISTDGRRFAQVIHEHGTPRERSMLMFFERGALVFGVSVASLREQATRITIEPSETPIMPVSTEPHRIMPTEISVLR